MPEYRAPVSHCHECQADIIADTADRCAACRHFFCSDCLKHASGLDYFCDACFAPLHKIWRASWGKITPAPRPMPDAAPMKRICRHAREHIGWMEVSDDARIKVFKCKRWANPVTRWTCNACADRERDKRCVIIR